MCRLSSIESIADGCRILSLSGSACFFCFVVVFVMLCFVVFSFVFLGGGLGVFFVFFVFFFCL